MANEPSKDPCKIDLGPAINAIRDEEELFHENEEDSENLKTKFDHELLKKCEPLHLYGKNCPSWNLYTGKRKRRFMSWFRRKKIKDLEERIKKLESFIFKQAQINYQLQFKTELLNLIDKELGKFEYKHIEPPNCYNKNAYAEIKEKHHRLGNIYLYANGNINETYEVYYKEKDLKEDK